MSETETTITNEGTVTGTTIGTEGTIVNNTIMSAGLDPDAISPVDGTGRTGTAFVQKPFTPAKSQLLGEFENLLHSVPADIEHDKEAILFFVNSELAKLYKSKPAP